jgi:hypothetical protein
MDLARYVVEAVVLEGRSYREVARAHVVSKSWVAKARSQVPLGGLRGAGAPVPSAEEDPPPDVPRARGPDRGPSKGALGPRPGRGAQTIQFHLLEAGVAAPSVATIWRVLRRRGFVTPQPHKRPRSS